MGRWHEHPTRAVGALLASLIVIGACAVLVARPSAAAQEPAVELTLISQTAITTHDEPLLKIEGAGHQHRREA